MNAIIFALLPALLVGVVLMGAGLLGERKARRENARRQARYRDECAQAKAFGLKPPFPPNVVFWR